MLIPPVVGNMYPVNYASGISVPALSVRTNPYKNFWKAATMFGAWFDLSATTRTGTLGVVSGATFFDGQDYYGMAGCKADSFNLDIVNGALVDLSMNFLGIDWATASGTITQSTLAPAAYRNVAFSSPSADGIHQAGLSFSNRCYPSGELSTDGRPVLIHAGAPVFSLSLLQKPGATVPTTGLTMTIAAPNSGDTLTFAMTFVQTGGPTKTVVFGELLYQRVFTGMRIAAAGVPMALS